MKPNNTYKKLVAATILGLSSTYALAADQITYQMDWLPGGDKAPVYVGVSKGFFAEQDIEVKIASGRGSTDAITKVATGNAEIGQADITALLAAKARQDVPVTAVMSIFSDAPYATFVKKDGSIKTIADLKGKKVVTSPFTSSNAFFPIVLGLNNVDAADVTVVKADPGALAPMLINDSADAVTSWVTDAQKYQSQAKKAGIELTVLPWHDAGMSIYSSSMIANNEWLAENPELAQRFITAFKKSIEYVYANPQESAEIINKAVPEVDVTVAKETIEAIHGLVYNDATKAFGLGSLNSKRLAETWAFTAQSQEIDVSALDPETVITRQFIGGE